MSPFQATWRPDLEGGALVPLRRFHNVLAAEFGAGEIVTLERREERSSASHNHYFACVESAWSNLPEDMAERWPTPEHLRRWALIKAGIRDERTFVCSSRAEALRLAAFMRPMDEYALITVRDAVVTVYVAKSQSMKAMDRKAFTDSKNEVLGVLATLIGVDPSTLSPKGAGGRTGVVA